MSMSGVLPNPRSYRRTELRMLVLVAVVATAALVAVAGNQQRPVSWQLLACGAGYFALFAAGHLAVRRFADHADPLLLPCAALLNGIGLVLNYRIDLSTPGRARWFLPAGAAPAQVVWTAVALAMFAAVLRWVPDHRQLGRYTYTAGLLGLFLLVLPGLLPASISQVNGAKLWLRIGPLSIQPGEFAKILIIVFAAGMLVAKRELFTTAGRRLFGMDLPRARDLAPLLVAWALAVGVLALEKELGASLLFFGIVLAMIYIATERISWLLIGLLFAAGGAVLAHWAFDHVRERVDVWLNPFAHAESEGFQIVQSLFGIAHGGFVGTGLGRGRPDLVPFASTDFITASIAEELGLAGLSAVLVLYLLLSARGFRAALAARDPFGKLLAGGLSFALGLQVFVVVGGVTRLIPLTGMTVPFLSYGGSSLLANFALAALLVRVSDSARRPEPEPAESEPLAEARTRVVQRPEPR